MGSFTLTEFLSQIENINLYMPNSLIALSENVYDTTFLKINNLLCFAIFGQPNISV